MSNPENGAVVASKMRKMISQKLKPLFAPDEARQLTLLMLAHLLEVSTSQLILEPHHTLSRAQQKQAWEWTEKLLQHEPIQYLLGQTYFYGLPFSVSPAVLIPRPETEELVHWILNNNPPATGRLLDLGTGSGCIAVALAAQLPKATIEAVDLSGDALQMATHNATRNQVQVGFVQGNLLSDEWPLTGPFDVIVSNPPYVRMQEKQAMKPNVLQYEPHLALFVPDDDALLFYRHIAQKALVLLAPGGKLYFEINEYLGNQMTSLLHGMGYQTLLRQDLQGKDRMICAML